MLYSIPFFELTLALNSDEFQNQLDRAYAKANKKAQPLYPTDFGYADEALISKGIGIAYYDDSKKKKIRLSVFPGLVIDDDFSDLWKPTDRNISRLTDKLDRHISSYFHSDYGLADFSLSRVDVAADIDVGSNEKVSDYLKVLHNIRWVKCFSPIKYEKQGEVTKENCFVLTGNSNGIVFCAHRLKHDKGSLRFEVRLTKKADVQACSDEIDTAEKIRTIAEKCENIFMDVFKYIIPPGDYYKKKTAETLIRKKVPDWNMRAKMLRLLVLIPEKKSLLLAQKEIDYRKIKRIMTTFAEINVSPVTISKRHDITKLDSLYSYFD